jgi:hypothetical protein
LDKLDKNLMIGKGLNKNNNKKKNKFITLDLNEYDD